MSSSEEIRSRRRFNLAGELAQKGWYHSLELPGGRLIEGIHTLENLRRRWARFGLPDDLRGKRALDIGAWDGWFSFELERRGAEVVAIDCVEIDNFVWAHRALGSKVDYRIMEFYDLSPRTVGYFNVILCLGVLYHLKHPLLALERICELTREAAVVETFAVNDDSAVGGHSLYPAMEFYETNELGDQFDNWVGPNVACLMALCRTAGFAQVELMHEDGSNACVRCRRKWDAEPESADVTDLAGASHYRDFGVNLSSRQDDYITGWFRHPAGELRREDVMPEVSGFGVMPIQVKAGAPGAWEATFKLPPGLAPGWHEVRLRTRGTRFGTSARMAVDLPLEPERVVIRGACDGREWTPDLVARGADPVLSLWLEGLPANADRANVRVELEGRRHPVVFVGGPDHTGFHQVNVSLDPALEAGTYQVTVRVGTVTSAPVRVELR